MKDSKKDRSEGVTRDGQRVTSYRREPIVEQVPSGTLKPPRADWKYEIEISHRLRKDIEALKERTSIPDATIRRAISTLLDDLLPVGAVGQIVANFIAGGGGSPVPYSPVQKDAVPPQWDEDSQRPQPGEFPKPRSEMPPPKGTFSDEK